MGNLKVADEEYTDIGTKIEDFGTVAEKQIETYFLILKDICSSSIADGYVHDNLVSFYNNSITLQGQISELTQLCKNTCTNYVDRIDQEDQYLY